MSIDITALAAPFPVAAISWRVGSVTQDKSRGMALAYIDARDVMRRLDAVVGPCNWRDEYRSSEGKRTICTLYIRCGDEWVGKQDCAGDTDVEAEKGAFSDAFKRAAVKWGIGRYLYDLDSPWVALKNGKYIEDAEFARLRTFLEKSAPPAHAKGGTPQPAPTPAPANPTTPPASGRAIDDIISLIVATHTDESKAVAWATDSRVTTAAELTQTEADKLLVMLRKKASAQPAA